MVNSEPQISNPKSQTLKRGWRFWSRIDVAAVLIFVVLLLAAFGSCFPQLPSSVAAEPERLAQWEASAREKYGALADFLGASGAFRWFRSPVFLIPLGLLAGATLVCTLDRWRSVWRRTFYQPVHCSDVALDSAPHTARLVVPSAVDSPNALRQCLKRRGFQVRTTNHPTNHQTNQPTIYLRGDRNRLTPLATLVTHLAVLLILLGAVLSSGYGWREEITIGPGEMAEVGHGSRMALRNDGFAIVRYPDGVVAGYEAKVTIFVAGQEAKRGSVQVNEPLSYDSNWFYLHGYQEAEGQYAVTLRAVRDPGYGVVIAGGFLLLLGLTVSFNLPHCWVHARIEPKGILRLAGRADKRAYGFSREFTAMVKEIERSIVSWQEQNPTVTKL